MNEEVKQDLFRALSFCEDAFIAGSYLVSPETANDIDVVIPQWGYDHPTLTMNGYKTQCDPALYTNCPELVSTYRKGKINVLVVSNFYVPAYFGAAQLMKASPEKYATREARIELHYRLKQIISQMTAQVASV